MLRVHSPAPRLFILLLAGITGGRAASAEPLRLHPDNPHYFLFRGKPAVLVTSGEHYGAVLNRDFDYLRYLDELRAGRPLPGCVDQHPDGCGREGRGLRPRRRQPHADVAHLPRRCGPARQAILGRALIDPGSGAG